MSLTTLSLTLCYLFIHSSLLEFRNLDFFIPCRSLYRKLWFKLLKLENPISYGHAMSFLMHVVAMYLTTLSLTLCYLFTQSSQLEFRNLDFFIPCGSLYRKLWSKLLKFENAISYGYAMRFLLHVLAYCSHYLVFDTMLPFHSLLSARVSEFRFFHPIL